eukprot:10953464-Alexandrium_andersonii.AAC.1
MDLPLHARAGSRHRPEGAPSSIAGALGIPTPPTPPVPPGSLSSGEGGIGHAARGWGIHVSGLPALGRSAERRNLRLHGGELRVDAADDVLRAAGVGAQRALELGELRPPGGLDAVQGLARPVH